MTNTKGITILGILLIVFLMLVAIAMDNFEFVYYSLLLIPFAYSVYYLEQKIHFPFYVFCLIFLVFILHTLGGLIHVHGIKLYDTGLWLIHYDNLVHFIASFSASLVIYSLLFNSFHVAWTKHKGLAFSLIVLATAGAGTIVEIIELIAVLLFPESAGVGGYTNNAVDLVVNLSSASLGAFFMVIYHSKNNK